MEGRVSVTIAMLVLVTLSLGEGVSSDLHPVVVVPGLLASTIEAQVTEDAPPLISIFCSEEGHNWFTLWKDSNLIASQPLCFLYGIELHYDADLDDFRNTLGFETRVPEIAESNNKLVESLRKIGYEDKKNLFGALYDFRHALAGEGHPSRVGSQFLQDLKELIENASALNGGKRVILLSHSLGGLFSLQLLNRNSLSWRQQYIKHFIPIATPWGGAVAAMGFFASGVSIEGIEGLEFIIRDIARSWESTLWLMPTPGAFAVDATLVVTPTTNYTAYNVSEFIQDTTGLPNASFPYESRILPLVENLAAPEVPTTVIIGTNVSTPETFIYNDTKFDQPPKNISGDGDGTVNLVSALRIQSEWAQNENQPTLKILKLAGLDHTALVTDDVGIDEIIGEISLINGKNTESPTLSVWTGKANA